MFTLGSDPELFLKDKETGTLFPICGKLGGTKDKPLPMTDMPDGFCVQEDNVMLEFNIPASNSWNAFARNIENAMTYIWAEAANRFNAEPIPVCSAQFPLALLDHAGARVFGCSPDFDGYNLGEKHQGIDRALLRENNSEWRFAGGHIHVGFGRRELPPFAAAQFADLYLGLPSVPFDKQGRRRQLYGKAGRYRPTKYGIEYRTLSNFWVFNPGILQTISQAAANLGSLLDYAPLEHLKKMHGQVPWNEVQTAIESEDVKLAGDLLAYVNDTLGIGDFRGR